MLGPNLLKDMKLTVKQVEQNLKVSQDKKKSHAGLKRTPRDFQVRDHVYIKVNTKKISLILGHYSKLAPRYFFPFEILAKVGQVAY